MRRRALNRWLKGYVLAPVLAVGCQHYYGGGYSVSAPQLTTESGTTQTVVYLYSETPIDGQTVTSDRLPRMTTSVTAPAFKPSVTLVQKNERPTEREEPRPAVVEQTATTTSPPPAEVAAKEPPATPRPTPMASLKAPEEKKPTKPEVDVVAAIPTDAIPASEVQQASATSTSPTDAPVRAASMPPTNDCTNPSASFWHNEDHTELRGQLQNTRLTKGWRLRYAPIDQDDEFGGSVRFTDDSQIDGFQDGQMVRVRGRLIADGMRIAPYFRVDSIEVIKE